MAGIKSNYRCIVCNTKLTFNENKGTVRFCLCEFCDTKDNLIEIIK